MTESDRFDALSTEQPNASTAQLDRLGTLEALTRINDEDLRVAPAVRAVLPELARAVDLAVGRWRAGGRIVLFGAGTSGRLAMLDAAELGPTYGAPPERYLARLAGGNTAMQTAAEGVEDDRLGGQAAAADLTPQDVAFGIAASGRTPWVMGALEAARQRGAITIGLACVPNPELQHVSDIVLAVDTGPEPIAGSTRMKAGTAQKLVLNAFSTILMVRLGKVYGNLMVDVQATNEKLRRRAARLVQQAAEVDSQTAERALAEASWEVKTAIVQLRLGVSVAEARARLAAVDGQIRLALGEGDAP
jgi:N-acetylmuramic acid 6-phosphate etherase